MVLCKMNRAINSAFAEVQCEPICLFWLQFRVCFRESPTSAISLGQLCQELGVGVRDSVATLVAAACLYIRGFSSL